jgi:microcystin-dependent protein
MEVFLGTIIMVGFGFVPTGWALCNGALLPISQYQALFALLGTTYGGDGVKTFALPDLRGCVPGGYGQGTNGPAYVMGQKQILAAAPPVAAPTSTEPRVLGVNFIIAVTGIFPQRD